MSDQLDEPKDITKDLDDITEQVACCDPPDEWLINYNYVSTMRKGDYVRRQFSITEATEQAWIDFMLAYTGTVPTRGRGISSAMVEFCMRLGMGVITEFKLKKVAKDFKQIVPNEQARRTVKDNIKRLADML